MSTSTRTVTINAAFLQEIKDDSYELRQLLLRADMLVATPVQGVAFAQAAAPLLEELCDQLALHFALEEAYGYFDDAIDVAPQLSHRSEVLRSQHAAMYRQLCGLLEAVEQLRYQEHHRPQVHDLIATYTAFRRALAEHESRETEIILEAFDDEIGGGD